MHLFTVLLGYAISTEGFSWMMTSWLYLQESSAYISSKSLKKNSYGSVHAHRNLHQLGICSAVQYPVLIKSFVLLKAIRAWKTTFCY